MLRRDLLVALLAGFTFLLGYLVGGADFDDAGALSEKGLPRLDLLLVTGPAPQSAVVVTADPPFVGTVHFEIYWARNLSGPWQEVVQASEDLVPASYDEEGTLRVPLGVDLDCKGAYFLVGSGSWNRPDGPGSTRSVLVPAEPSKNLNEYRDRDC